MNALEILTTVTNIISGIVAFIALILITIYVKIIEDNAKKHTDEQNDDDVQKLEKPYVKPQLKPLTAEQIAEIHSRGKITPAEQLAEWESWGLCAPGDAIGSAAWRCRKFRNCHDCLIDFVNEHDEYTSIVQIMQENKYRSTKL